MKKIIYPAAIAAALFCVVSCETERTGNRKKDIRLAVTAEMSTKSADRAELLSEAELISSEGLTLYLTTTESDNLANPLLSQTVTKGTIVTSENFEDERSGDFNVRITDAGTTSVYCEARASDRQNKGEWYITDGSEYAQWPDDENARLDFWAWSGAEGCSSISLKDSKTLTFAYDGSKKSAETQTDLIFANTPDQSSASDGSVKIHFYHALAAVQFVVGNLDNGIIVNGISINNVKTCGNCSFIPAEKSVDTRFAWSGQSSPATYSQKFSENSKNYKTDRNFQQCFDGSEARSTFFVMPQSLAESENITLTINVTDSLKRTYELTHVIKGSADISEWKAGKIYRYMISNGEGDVDVKVWEDSFDGETKKGVKAENTGSLPTYIRAAVVANWYNSAGKIVRPYTGEIACNSVSWYYSDGFYYYKEPLPGGQTTDSLISEFVLTDTAPDNTGYDLHLEMNVFFQAVEYIKGMSYGPSNFVKQ